MPQRFLMCFTFLPCALFLLPHFFILLPARPREHFQFVQKGLVFLAFSWGMFFFLCGDRFLHCPAKSSYEKRKPPDGRFPARRCLGGKNGRLPISPLGQAFLFRQCRSGVRLVLGQRKDHQLIINRRIVKVVGARRIARGRGMTRRFSDGCDAVLASCGPDMEIDGPTPELSPASFHLFQISNL